MMSCDSVNGEDSRSTRRSKPEKEVNMDTNMCNPRRENNTTCIGNGTENDTNVVATGQE